MSNDNDLHIALPGSFFGVYILYNVNPKFKGQVYIGFTANPERRIRQHNREIKGGAAKTGRNRGPWDMVLITHGFNTKLAALQFEWAWQNPLKSRRLSHLPRKHAKENPFTYRIRILSEMLNTGPWNRLPLTIQWLKQQYYVDFPLKRQPPSHMPIAYGEITTVKKISTNIETKCDTTTNNTEQFGITCPMKDCMICSTLLENMDEYNKVLTCIVDKCDFVAHSKCLAKHFLYESKDAFILPISGSCPLCKQQLMWSDMIKQKKYALDELEFSESQEEETDQLSQEGFLEDYDDFQ